jgi:hypothetical protein
MKSTASVMSSVSSHLASALVVSTLFAVQPSFAADAVQWRVQDGGNGHWYQFVRSPGGVCWNSARAAAEAIGGHLATVTSSTENQFVISVAALNNPGVSENGPFLGATCQNVPWGQWSWVTGEPFSFTAWGSGEPNSGGSERYLHLWRWSGLWWNDVTECDSKSYIVEWSADCNSDGTVDFGQIRQGYLADVDADGVPDICQATILVPAQFPTIQAAINSVPAGVARTIQVAAGTYNQAFSLNGKNVVVRGAANGATVLDGTGLPESIARFTGGEPETAGVEDLVFRNGTSGSRFTPSTAFTVGGAIFGAHTAAFIRNCRFENCRADYGGAVYQYHGRLTWENVVFAGNTANDEGGGALVYNCTGSVSGSTFTGNRCGMFGPGSGSAFKAVGANGTGESVVLDTCSFTGNIAGDSGSAIEFYEHAKFQPGVLRLVNTQVSGNLSGQPTPTGAGGLRVIGSRSACVLAGTTVICSNQARNASGPYMIEGAAEVCDCQPDITGDGAVNGADLGIVLSSWGIADSLGTGDVSRDGVVDGEDLALVLSNWGACGSS